MGPQEQIKLAEYLYEKKVALSASNFNAFQRAIAGTANEEDEVKLLDLAKRLGRQDS